METLLQFNDESNELFEANRLLDDILMGYDVYTKEFRFSKDKFPNIKLEKSIGYEKAKLATHTWISEEDELNERIRAYKNFDDSE